MNNTIQAYIKSGLRIIPIRVGKKIPALGPGEVERIRATAPNTEEYGQWQLPIAILAGKYSGGVICIDFDDHGSCYSEWCEIVESTRPGCTAKLVVESTPSGGYHVIYRTDSDEKAKKLAEKGKNEPKEEGKGGVLIETRATDTYFVCAPSDGYKIIHGDLTKIYTAPSETHELFMSAARSLNRLQKYEAVVDVEPPKAVQAGECTPMDDYDLKHTALDVLTKHGWTVLNTRRNGCFLCRPDKKGSISATWNLTTVQNRFCAFTTSTVFEANKLYKPSAVYAMLEHGGNFKAAAKTLYAAGYGDRVKPQTAISVSVGKQAEYSAKGQNNEPSPAISRLVTIESLRCDMDNYRIYGAVDNGVSTGWPELDCYYRPAKSQFTVVTGIPSHGKSTFFDHMMVNIAKKSKWKWLVFSPETYPFTLHIRQLMEKYIKCAFSTISDAEYSEAMEWLNDHFMFVDHPMDGTRLVDILEEARPLFETWCPDAIVIDPFNELTHQPPPNESETNYIGTQISTARNFARKNNVAFFIIAHPTKMQKDKVTQEYNPPTPYDIAGSAHWYNKCDNALCVHRDFKNDITAILIQKIKFKMYGKIGNINMKYEPSYGGYTPENLMEGF